MRWLHLAAAGFLALAPANLLWAQSSTRPVKTIAVQPFGDQPSMYSGTVESQLSIDYGFQIQGRLIDREVDVGDEVEAGQVLARIESAVQEQEVRSAQAALIGAQASLANATTTEGRQRALLSANAVARSRVEEAELSLQSARSSVRQSEASLDQARRQLDYTQLVARFSGAVTAVGAEPGQVVSAGDSVVTVAQTGARDAVVDIPEAAASLLRIGVAFPVHLALSPDLQVKGTVREIGPLADRVTRTRRVKLAIPDAPPSYRLGSIISVALPGGDTETLALPAAAVLQRDGQTFVWVLKDGQDVPELRPVTVRQTPDGQWSVAEGLQAGEQVIAAGVNSIKDGQHVRVQGAS
ncbi:efflux RND transporter periplasmic adaptor subunit [Falsirhodobacter sp. 1013]|uniref:efflux RND transporter periplasmic adaptor subunit n=1 Tax=Falsirhodobacter sp. 1013 TaxID=3417566 RepID=UPI003EB8EF84